MWSGGHASKNVVVCVSFVLPGPRRFLLDFETGLGQPSMDLWDRRVVVIVGPVRVVPYRLAVHDGKS
jgi:hypothetical protein